MDWKFNYFSTLALRRRLLNTLPTALAAEKNRSKSKWWEKKTQRRSEKMLNSAAENVSSSFRRNRRYRIINFCTTISVITIVNFVTKSLWLQGLSTTTKSKFFKRDQLKGSIVYLINTENWHFCSIWGKNLNIDLNVLFEC